MKPSASCCRLNKVARFHGSGLLVSRTFGGWIPSALRETQNQGPEIDDVSMVGWDGYAASHRRVTQGWVDARVRNAVVLTGDVHRRWANDVKVDFKDFRRRPSWARNWCVRPPTPPITAPVPPQRRPLLQAPDATDGPASSPRGP